MHGSVSAHDVLIRALNESPQNGDRFQTDHPTKRRRAWSSARCQTARSVADGRYSTALTCATTCVETEHETSLRTAEQRVEHSRTWDEKQLRFISVGKTTYTNLLFISHTGTVTPRYQPPIMADSVTSHCPWASASELVQQAPGDVFNS